VLRGVTVLLLLVTLLAVSVEVYLRSRARAHGRRIEVVAERELLGGGLQGLLRARAMALGGAAIANDDEAAATVALASAILASEYGLEEGNTARSAADSIDATPHASPRAQALKLASRALVEATAGHAAQAEALARQSVSLGHKQASPLFALGRVRFRQGDLEGAGRAFQAALVREPGLVEARAALAEVWLELGDPGRAREGLLVALRKTPDHGRAGLLLAESDGPSLDGRAVPWEPICARDEATSPFLAGACDLARAARAWHGRDRDAAIRFATAAGRRRPAEPRSLGRAAQLLASLGAVDQASACLDQAMRIASPSLPSLRWATIAVELGRGQLVNPPRDLPLGSSPWAAMLMARIALASGGVKALIAALPELRKGGTEVDALALLLESEVAEPAATTVMDPAQAYVQGFKARLAGKPRLAVAFLSKALHGHGDACRAAGEYVAVCGLLGRAPDAGALAALAEENRGCVNLRQ
jgi:tetratricopeptide (TPR) repeat protein